MTSLETTGRSPEQGDKGERVLRQLPSAPASQSGCHPAPGKILINIFFETISLAKSSAPGKRWQVNYKRCCGNVTVDQPVVMPPEAGLEDAVAGVAGVPGLDRNHQSEGAKGPAHVCGDCSGSGKQRESICQLGNVVASSRLDRARGLVPPGSQSWGEVAGGRWEGQAECSGSDSPGPRFGEAAGGCDTRETGAR